MNQVIKNYLGIQENINQLKLGFKTNVIAVSKTFPLSHIKPLIDYGHLDFGENKVQEAIAKWSNEKVFNNKIKLHMIGKLQSNKAKSAVQIFDYIHSLDSQKLADILCKSENAINKKLKYFIQINVGNESQKSGIRFQELDQFYTYCIKELKINILGLMMIPPVEIKNDKYFKILLEANASLGLKDLSMGMSSDYLTALKYDANFLRIGSLIFGKRG